MYSHYFGLKELPFSIAPNPRYLFMSEQHREALGHLLYGVGVGGGFVMLTGEVGTGKTTVSRCLLEQLPENTDIAFILNPLQTPTEMVATICDELGVEYSPNKPSLRNLTLMLYRFLIRNHASGRNTVLLIDEAQNLEDKMLELVRLLTNLETNTKKLLQIIFVGQPELKARLEKPHLRQLAQRITARTHINPLNLQETQAYIRHRLQVAGLPAGQELIPARIVKRVYKRTGGIPRLINVLCDRMLLGAYAQNKSVVDRATFEKAQHEVMGLSSSARMSNWRLSALVASVCLVTIAGLLTWFWPLNAPLSLATSEVSQAPPPAAGTAGEASQDAATAPLDSATDIEALNEVFLNLGQIQAPLANPCDQASAMGWRCEQVSVRGWRDIRQINRPGVLVLQNGEEALRYGALVGLGETRAELSVNGKRHQVPLIELGERWGGEFIFVWKPPAKYEKPLAKGDKAPLVEWLSIKFAHLDDQTSLLARKEFNVALAERLKLFQQQHRLEASGKLDLRTLLRLNEVLGDAVTLTRAADNNTQRQGEG